MDPDNYQQAWKAHSAQLQIKFDPDLLLNELHKERLRQRSIGFWIGLMLSGIALILVAPDSYSSGFRVWTNLSWYAGPLFFIFAFLMIGGAWGLWMSQRPVIDELPSPHGGKSADAILNEFQKDLRFNVNGESWILWAMIITFPMWSLLSWFASGARLSDLLTWKRAPFDLITGWMVLSSAWRLYQKRSQIRDQIEPVREPSEGSLLACVKESLNQWDCGIEGVINLWFGLTLTTVVCGVFFYSLRGLDALSLTAGCAATMSTTYFLMQIFVRWSSRPKRERFLMLLETLKDETSSQGDQSVEILIKRSHELEIRSKRYQFGSLVITVTALLIILFSNLRATAWQRARVARSAVSIEDVEPFKERIDEFLETAQRKTGFSGVVVVAKKGEPIYQGTFGYSHLQSKTANSLDTPFHIASLSKQFTAAAILSLEAEGKLSVDDPVHRYLPDFDKEPYRSITLHQLMTHTSGLPRTPEDFVGRTKWAAMSKAATPAEEYANLAVQLPLKFKPGEGYEYSNFGYRILSAVITRVTGQEYAEFMDERLFKPLAMKHAGVARLIPQPTEAEVAEELRFVSFDRKTNEPKFASAKSNRNYGSGHGSGGIYASANDLLRWDRVLAENSFLSAEQTAKLFQPIKENYACGWVVKKSGLDGRLYQTHSGANEGYFSKMMRVPEDDLVIIALGNLSTNEAIDDVLEQLFRLCRSLPYQDP